MSKVTEPAAQEAKEPAAEEVKETAAQEAKEPAAEEVKETAAQEVKEAPAPKAKPNKVKIRLFRDNDKYKGDVTVILNGKVYKIQRGVEVEVPAAVAEIIENSMKQDADTAQLIEREVAAGKAAERAIGFIG